MREVFALLVLIDQLHELVGLSLDQSIHLSGYALAKLQLEEAEGLWLHYSEAGDAPTALKTALADIERSNSGPVPAG